MRQHSISVQFPRLSSVFQFALWSGLLMPGLMGTVRADNTAELRSERMIGPGVRCTTLIRSAGPWVIHIVEADGESRYVRPGATFASERGLRAAPVSAQALQATQENRYPIAGVNGDFFAETPGPYEADPVGALVVGGEVIHTPMALRSPRSAFLIGADGRYAIRRLRLAAWVERVAPEDEHEQEHEREGAKGGRVALTGVNQPCGANDLVLYTPRFGLSTRTKGSINEATLTGLALPIRQGTTNRAQVTAVGSAGDAPIPADGVVLSGRGAGEFFSGLRAGDTVQLRLDFDPPVPPDTEVIGGGPALVRDGRVVVTEDTEGFQPDVVAGRAPRTAVGFNGRRLMLVTVDGRAPGVSVGMSLIELAALMRELGCTAAMNLDGGGSTTAWVRGAVVNQPSAGQERRVAEGVFLFSTAPKGPPQRLTVAPEEISVLAGASCPLTVTGEDEYDNPVPTPADPPAWQVDPDLGTVDASGRLVAAGETADLPAARSGAASAARAEPRVYTGGTLLKQADGNGEKPAAELPPLSTHAGSVRVQCGRLAGSAPVRIYSRPPRLVVSPPHALLAPGGERQFAVRALDEWGRPLITDGVPVHWSCAPELGTVDETGLFRAAGAPGQGELTVEIAGTRAAVPIVVGIETRLLDGFEVAGRWTGSATPAEVIGSASLVEDAPHEGQHCLQLEYDFSAGGGTRAVYANTRLLIGQPTALRLWVRGEGGGAWLRARLRDARGHVEILDFTHHLGWLESWHELAAAVSPALPGPLTLEAVYLVETDPHAQPKGAIELDGLAGDYAPPAAGGTLRAGISRR